MEILFIRHGESFDDQYDEYGSWSDRGLTPAGYKLAFDLAKKLKSEYKKSDIILSSPLQRALQTAKIIGSELQLRVEEFAYLKERNTYGLLSGVNKEEAIEMYPELNSAFLSGSYIHGAERYPDAKLRVEKMLEELSNMKTEKIICLTHGHIMTILIEEHLKLIRNSIGDGGILHVKLEDGKLELINTEGISFTDDPVVIEGLEIRKFKKE